MAALRVLAPSIAECLMIVAPLGGWDWASNRGFKGDSTNSEVTGLNL